MIIVNKHLVPKGYKGMTVYPFIFLVDEECKNDAVLINHERIHIKQQLEMLVIPFFIWYLLEFLIHLWHTNDSKLSYRSISFEREAYTHQKDLNYLKTRKLFSWKKYI